MYGFNDIRRAVAKSSDHVHCARLVRMATPTSLCRSVSLYFNKIGFIFLIQKTQTEIPNKHDVVSFIHKECQNIMRKLTRPVSGTTPYKVEVALYFF